MQQLCDYLWLFIFGSFFGFVIETIWCLIRWKKFESRKGLIYGHFIPIYGIAGLFLAIVIDVLNIGKKFLVFIASFLIGGFVEYFSSLFQEKVTGTISWDYSDMKFNLHGRVNLIYLIGFGLFGLLWYMIYPRFLSLLHIIFSSNNIFVVISVIVGLLMLCDMFISLVAMIRQKRRREGKLARNKFESWLDYKYPDSYLKRVYANSKFVK